MSNFKYTLEDFQNKNEEVWNYIENLSCEEIINLLEVFYIDKEIRKDLINLIKEKSKSLSIEEIDHCLEKSKETNKDKTPFGDYYTPKNKDKVFSILEKRKIKIIKKQIEDSVFPVFKEFYNNLSKDHREALNEILYNDETRYRDLRRQL